MSRLELTIVPIGGLANRLRVITSVLHLSASSQDSIPVRIVWRSNKACRAWFEELFLPVKQENIAFSHGSYADEVSSRYNLWLPALLRIGRYSVWKDDINPSVFPVEKILGQEGKVHISTCHALCDYDPQKVKDIFRPRQDIMDMVESFTEKFSAHTLGVHIRRTDNKQSILHSPLSEFEKRTDSYLETFADAKIFLCSDEKRVKDFFRQRYGEHLLTRQAVLSRNSLKGMQDAVADLWCLSRTHTVIGSYYSSFSDTATEIGGQPLEIIKI